MVPIGRRRCGRFESREPDAWMLHWLRNHRGSGKEGDAWHRCYQDVQNAENEALSRLTGGCQTQGDRLASTLSPTPQPQGRQGSPLTQDVGGHPQQGVEHVVDLPVPLDHIGQLLIIHESGGCSGIWGDPLTTVNLP